MSLRKAEIMDGSTLMIEVEAGIEGINMQRQNGNVPEQPVEHQVAEEHFKKEPERCCPRELLPTMPDSGYETIPSYPALCQMTERELRNLPEFTISN